MQSLSNRLGKFKFPSLEGKDLWVTSDYVFGNKKSEFDVIAVLLAMPERSIEWESDRQNVRQHGLQHRRMSFKSLGDSVRQKSLIPFLLAADDIHGVVFSIAIDKSVSKHFVMGPSDIEASFLCDWVREKWKLAQFDRMVTVTHFIAFLVAGLSSTGQNVTWISDQDDVFANSGLSQDTGTLFTKYLNAYSNHPYGKISIGTTAITEEDLLEEDLAAIADIAAGGSAELLTALRNEFESIPGVAVLMPKLSTRAQVFFDWYSSKLTRLTKVGCVFEKAGRTLRVSTWT